MSTEDEGLTVPATPHDQRSEEASYPHLVCHGGSGQQRGSARKAEPIAEGVVGAAAIAGSGRRQQESRGDGLRPSRGAAVAELCEVVAVGGVCEREGCGAEYSRSTRVWSH